MNNTVTITQRAEFSCGYIMNRELNCKRYRIEATIGVTQKAEDECESIILDFATFKELLNRIVPHNTFLISEHYSMTDILAWSNLHNSLSDLGCKVVYVDFPICTETLCAHLAEEFQQTLPDNVLLLKVNLYEDSYSYSTWVAEHT